MALRTCPHCKKSISSQSKTCPYCSKPLHPMIQKPKPSPNRAKFLVNVGHAWLGIAFLVGLITYIAGYSVSYTFNSLWWIGLVIIAICLALSGIFYIRANHIIPHSISFIKIGIAIGFLLIIFIVFTLIATRRPTPSPPSQTTHEAKTPYIDPTPITSPSTTSSSAQDTMALTMAKEFVLKHVKYPNNTKFPMFQIDRERLPNGKYRVTGKVDTPNDFGATLRYSYEVVLYQEGEHWYADSVDIHP